MKTSMLPVIFLHMLTYVVYCIAAPTSPTSTPAPIGPFKMRVWNKVNGPNVRGFDGYTQLANNNDVVFNYTASYPGFDVYIDNGFVRTSSGGLTGALIPTQISGLYDFKFMSYITTQGALSKHFGLKYLGCGMCIGKYLQYDPTSTDLNVDNTNSSFIITPSSQHPQGWKLQWNQFSKNPNVPVGSYIIYLLQQ